MKKINKNRTLDSDFSVGVRFEIHASKSCLVAPNTF